MWRWSGKSKNLKQLCDAAIFGDLSEARRLIEEGADVNATDTYVSCRRFIQMAIT
jgi:hypothetical protein